MVASAAVLWGGWPLVLRPSGLGALESALVVLAVLALPAPLALDRRALRDCGATRALLLLGVADAANVALYFAAIHRGPVAVAVLTHYLAPVLVAIAAPLFGERRSPRASAAAPLSLGGLALIVWRPGGGAPVATAALGAASAVFYALAVFAAKRAGRAHSPLAVTALHAAVSAALLVAVSGGAAVPPLGAGALRVAAGAVVCGIGASLLFYAGLARVPSPVAGALAYLEPVSAAALGCAFLGERLDLAGLAGAAVVLGCGAWVALERPAPGGITGASAGPS